MKKMFLIRHGAVDFAKGIRRCIGSTDLSLSGYGQKQSEDLQVFFKQHKNIVLYSSPLKRSVETASIIADQRVNQQIASDLRELDMGEWENKPLNSIKKTLTSQPEHGEKRDDALLRIKSAIKKILADNKENSFDIVCVAHASINSCFIADLLGVPLEISRSFPQTYGCINEFEVDNLDLKIKTIGVMPKPYPDNLDCKRILNHYKTPAHIQEHCRAVASKAVVIGEKLNFNKQYKKHYKELDLDLLKSASILHDVARLQKNHAMEGAHILRREGYPIVANLIAQHHALENPLLIDEAAILFYADKIVEENKTVSLEERFSKSWEKMQKKTLSRGAIDSFYRNKRQAYIVEKILFDFLGQDGF